MHLWNDLQNSKSLVEDFIFIQNVKDQARHFWRVFWQMRSRQDARFIAE